MPVFPTFPGFRARRASGFTLVELLVVIAIAVVLLGVLLPVVRKVVQSGAGARELTLARQLMAGMNAYAYDNRGAVLPGYYDVEPLSVTDGNGNPVGSEEARRYPWRLAPYLGFDFEGLFTDDRLLEDLRNEDLAQYLVSLYPALGMNTMFIGGDSRPEGLGFNDQFEGLYGRFYLTRISQAKRPAELITFASARTNVPYAPDSPPIIEGFHRVESPFLFSRRWDSDWSEDAAPKKWGYASMRHNHRESAVGFFDGHTGYLDDGEMQDMRRWADLADRPDWTLQVQS